MSDAATAPFGVPNREGHFEDRAGYFQAHANKLADTAKHVAAAGGCTNKHTIEGIHATAQQVSGISPFVFLDRLAKDLFIRHIGKAAIVFVCCSLKSLSDRMIVFRLTDA